MIITLLSFCNITYQCPSQEPKIKYTTEPAILRSMEFQVLCNSKDGRVTQRGLSHS